jgi:diketogulonate reductase-like aldo/keto reductase
MQVPQRPKKIDPARVPFRVVSSGARIPAVGLGTFGSDHVSGETVGEAVLGAAEIGYRHFDCASIYGNERFVGSSLVRVLETGVRREDLWITSKLWNDRHAEKDVIPACLQTLKDLQLDHLDLYLVHWPFPNFHPPGCSVDSRSPDAKPYIHENFMRTWRQLERLVDLGVVRHIGTSNVTIPKLRLILRDARIKPSVNEMELHPHFQQPELFNFVREHGIVPTGFCPIGSPARPTRDRTADDTVDIDDPVIAKIARDHGVHPASICVKWAVQRGQIPIPFSTNRRHYFENLQAVVTDPLSESEMASIAKLDRNCRLIKGQVFLWKENQRWEDLWDLDGEIAN